jgi:hypothetical protein
MRARPGDRARGAVEGDIAGLAGQTEGARRASGVWSANPAARARGQVADLSAA